VTKCQYKSNELERVYSFGRWRWRKWNLAWRICEVGRLFDPVDLSEASLAGLNSKCSNRKPYGENYGTHKDECQIRFQREYVGKSYWKQEHMSVFGFWESGICGGVIWRMPVVPKFYKLEIAKHLRRMSNYYFVLLKIIITWPSKSVASRTFRITPSTAFEAWSLRLNIKFSHLPRPGVKRLLACLSIRLDPLKRLNVNADTSR